MSPNSQTDSQGETALDLAQKGCAAFPTDQVLSALRMWSLVAHGALYCEAWGLWPVLFVNSPHTIAIDGRSASRDGLTYRWPVIESGV